MAPRFDRKEQKWLYGGPEDEPSAGYDALGSLLRHGPLPFFQRVFKADEYEQAVLKFMAVEKLDRNQAQGNMDAYLRNPNDWAIERFQMQKTGSKIDYAKLETKSLVLTLAWVVALVSYSTFLYGNLKSGGAFDQNPENLVDNFFSMKGSFKLNQ